MHTRALLLLFLLALVGVHAEAGVILRRVEIIESDDAENSGRQVMRVLAEGARMKTVFEQSRNPMMPAGSYILAPGGDMVYLVDPASRTIARIDVVEMESIGERGQEMAERQAATTGAKTEVRDLQLEKTLDEPGPEMLGFATRHYRYELSYTEEQDMQGMPGSFDTRVRERHEFWAAGELADEPSLAAIAVDPMAAQERDAVARAVLEAEQKMRAHGLFLKHVLERRVSSGMGGASGLMGGMMGMNDSTEERITVEVTELERVAVPASEFALPTAYAERELMGPGGSDMPDLDALPGMGGAWQPGGEEGDAGMPDLDSMPR